MSYGGKVEGRKNEVKTGVEPQESRLKIEWKRSWEKLKRKVGTVRSEMKKEQLIVALGMEGEGREA